MVCGRLVWQVPGGGECSVLGSHENYALKYAEICGNMRKYALKYTGKPIWLRIFSRTWNISRQFFGTLPGFQDFQPHGSTNPITRKTKGEATGREATGWRGPTMQCKAIYALFCDLLQSDFLRLLYPTKNHDCNKWLQPTKLSQFMYSFF